MYNLSLVKVRQNNYSFKMQKGGISYPALL